MEKSPGRNLSAVTCSHHHKKSDGENRLCELRTLEDHCKAACTLGKKLKVPVYEFLKEPLVRKYGEEFYEALDATAHHPVRKDRTGRLTSTNNKCKPMKKYQSGLLAFVVIPYLPCCLIPVM